jgi:predicted regulator of Ras-like GTPase activity (Roadblock/LC7/MglB family)
VGAVQSSGHNLHQFAWEPAQLERIERIFMKELIEIGGQSVLLIDMIGNIILNCDNGHYDKDIYTIAALASANFAAVSSMAKIVGEQDFSLLFHKGKNENVHFTKIDDDYLLVTIFGSDVALGDLRMRLAGVIRKILLITGQPQTS